MAETNDLPEQIPLMTRESVRETLKECVMLSVVTIQNSQYNFRVFPDEAESVISDWTNQKREDIAAVSFWGQGIEGRRHVGRWTFATAIIAAIRQYTEAEYKEKAVLMSAPEPNAPRGRG
jgi:hypothetical protein